MSGTSGKVALVTSGLAQNACGSTAIPCNAAQLALIVDWVAYGAAGNGTAGNGEGGTSVKNGVALTSTQGGVRKLQGCQDTDNNNLDFDVVTAPVPRNSASPLSPCAFTLTVGRAGTGSGQVTSNPAGITCGVDCDEAFSSGTVVTLTAVPDAGSSFASWTGEPCAGLPENCDVTMSQARSVTATFNVAATATSTATATPVSPPTTCFAPDNGTGTIDLPAAECRHFGGPLHVTDGLPAGTELLSAGSLDSFFDIVRAPGGSLGGEHVTAKASMQLMMRGTGTQSGYQRLIEIPIQTLELDSAPRTPGNPVQSFDTDMFRMFGQAVAIGDPDFDLLRITGGTDFGLPSPGHTTLTQLPGGNWAVDSFFDITYRIDFVGHPGGPFSGMSGSTTGTIRMSQRSGPRPRAACSRPDNGAGTIDLFAECRVHGAPMVAIDGLPPGTMLHSDSFFDVFLNMVRAIPGGLLGGERDEFDTSMMLDMCGTGTQAAYCRSIPIPMHVAMDSAPCSPGNPVQSFDTDMFVMQGQVGGGGDPDFDLLRITGGTGFGMPSPGHTTLTRIGAGPNWNVDSFFDITYRIDFVGKPGGPFGGMSGSTTATIRMYQGVTTTPPTPTATSTPTPPARSITVLKLNHATGDPLPGWTMNLYGGPGCTGPVLDTLVTNGDGLVDFLGLSNGDYSVAEVMQPGWTPFTGVCQDTTLARPGGSSGPATGEYPGMGDDTFASGAHLTLELQGMPPMHLTSNGPTTVHRSEPCTGTCTPDGRSFFDTEMLSMQLQGMSPVGPFMVRESPTRASTGRTTQQSPGVDFPADSFFDVFFEIDTAIGPLHNDQPLHMSSVITSLPAYGSLFQSDSLAAIPVLDSSNQPVGLVRSVTHIPLPPDEILIVFRNVPPPATPTFTPTPVERSITVIKLNDTTGAPLPGWTMNLYGGPGCAGPILDTQVTGSNGLADFVGLSNGDYSVAEVVQGGWTPITPVCQDMSLSGTGGGGGGGGCGGGAGDCTSDSGVHMKLEIQGMPMQHVTASGPTTVHRSSTCPGCGAGGRDYFDTEMLSMDLQGTNPVLGPFMIRESPTKQSTGRTTQQTPGVDFPADSFFDVFFEIQSAAGLYHFGNNPDNICAVTTGYPPTNSPYTSMGSHVLFDAANQPVGFVHDLLHVTLPPGEILIVFRNQPPAATPTETATATPTPINHSITVLKVNDTTGLPIGGWTMNLYSGPGCGTCS